MTRLFLLFHGRFPSEKAASLFTAKNAEAFARQGLEVVVVVPRRKGIPAQDAFDFYKVERNFKVVYVPTLDLFHLPLRRLVFWASMAAFSISSFFYIKRESRKEDVIYSNEALPLFLASSIRPKCFYEMHDFPESKLWLFRKFLERMPFILVHNRWKLGEVKKVFRTIPDSRLLYEPNAVDLGAFDIELSAKEARSKLGLPQNKKIAVYTGHLYGWKGVDILARAAGLLGDGNLVAFVGGTDKDIEAFKRTYGASKNILIAGRKPHEEIPLWQKAADALILPNTGKEKISAYYTSPMKLFEYMASKRPIVASDIPSVREIVDEKSAILVPPDDAEALAEAMQRAMDGGESQVLAEAFSRVREHTWENRARRIINFLNASR